MAPFSRRPFAMGANVPDFVSSYRSAGDYGAEIFAHLCEKILPRHALNALTIKNVKFLAVGSIQTSSQL
jgi:hypothetical protein